MAVKWRSLALLVAITVLMGLVVVAPVMAAGGSVNGVVSDSQSAAPIPGIDVELWDWAGGLDPVATTTAGVSGDYAFAGIAPGTYEVWAGSGSYYWDSAPTTFTVTADEAFTRDIALDPIPDLSGTVYDEATNSVAGASVTAWWFDSATHDYYECAWTTSDANGAFDLSDIGSGDYLLTVDAVGYFSATYLDRGYFDRSYGTLISVLDTDVTGVDVHLKTAAGTGTLNITAQEFLPGTPYMKGVAGVTGAFTLSGGTSVPYVLDSNGTFSASVPAGEYEVTFEKPGYYSDSRHATVAADSAGSAFALLSRTPPAITGTVNDLIGSPVSHVAVGAYKATAAGWAQCATVETDVMGEYSFPVLEPGTYRVGVAYAATDDSGRWYDSCFWAGADSVEAATDVEVMYGLETPGVDLALTQVTPTASGWVTDRLTGLKLAGARVELLERDGSGFRTVAQATSSADGSYALLGGVRGSIYRLKASLAGYATQATGDATFTGPTNPCSFSLTPGGDTTAPSLTCSVTGNRTRSVVLSVKTGDGSGGIPNLTYSVNGGIESPCPKTLTFTVAGDYSVRVSSTDFSGNKNVQMVQFWVTGDSLSERVPGANRYDVAVNLASRLRATRSAAFTDVIVACGEDRAAADPLGAAALAGAYDCPVLLTPTAKYNLSTILAIKSMAAANGGRINIHVVGGTASIPKGVYNAIAAARGAGAVERINGANRYALAYQIACRTKSVLAAKGKSVPGVIVVNIENPSAFNDALAVSPISARAHMPLIGVRGASVPSEANAALSQFPGMPRYALNSAYLTSAVRGATGCSSVVTGSSNREVAAVDIAKWGVANGFLNYRNVGLVNKLSDALPAGAAMGTFGGPLLYTSGTAFSSVPETLIHSVKSQVAHFVVFGGESTISEAVRDFFCRQIMY